MLFIVLYQREAHAGEKRGRLDYSDIEQPESYDARLELAKRSCQELKIATKVVIDDMDNRVREAYGQLPNSAYFIEKGGKIHHKEAWARPDEWGPILKKMLEDTE